MAEDTAQRLIPILAAAPVVPVLIIEDVDVADRLRRLGCEYGQGYFFSMSMAPELLPEWAARALPLERLGTVRGQVNALIR